MFQKLVHQECKYMYSILKRNSYGSLIDKNPISTVNLIKFRNTDFLYKSYMLLTVLNSLLFHGSQHKVQIKFKDFSRIFQGLNPVFSKTFCKNYKRKFIFIINFLNFLSQVPVINFFHLTKYYVQKIATYSFYVFSIYYTTACSKKFYLTYKTIISYVNLGNSNSK